MTEAEKQAFYDKYGIWPVTDDDIPEKDKLTFTDSQLETSAKQQKAGDAHQYLLETDWYAYRKAETGKAIPDDVLEKRAQARLDISEAQGL
tara:strand:+ start:352 stop:624 length:273 start_codon:yes stop_codon:yes gene_type:complete